MPPIADSSEEHLKGLALVSDMLWQVLLEHALRHQKVPPITHHQKVGRPPKSHSVAGGLAKNSVGLMKSALCF